MSTREATILAEAEGLIGDHPDGSPDWDDWLSECESPIERLFVPAILVQPTVLDGRVMVTPNGVAGPYVVDVLLDSLRAVPDSTPPREVAEVTMAIELDGHDYHERTKDQARRDRERDRHLLRMGLVPIRFTGSEVYRDPFACAREALETLDAYVAKLRERRP